MVDFALNHMTVANASYATLIDLAARLGCIGVEVRNDLGKPLFDGRAPEEAGAMAREKGLRILCVAEVKQFNAWDDAREGEARDLVRTATAAGAEAVCLIPRNDGIGTGDGERQASLRGALRGLGADARGRRNRGSRGTAGIRGLRVAVQVGGGGSD